jgi:hypothetical protein
MVVQTIHTIWNARSGGSSGGESALIAACGSPLGLGSDAAASIRVPASVLRDHEHETDQRAAAANGSRSASWRLDRSALADRPMARYTEDLELAMKLLSGEDEADFTSPPVPLFKPDHAEQKLIAFFTYNGIARCSHEIENAVRECADFFFGARPARGRATAAWHRASLRARACATRCRRQFRGVQLDDGLESSGRTRSHSALRRNRWVADQCSSSCEAVARSGRNRNFPHRRGGVRRLEIVSFAAGHN